MKFLCQWSIKMNAKIFFMQKTWPYAYKFKMSVFAIISIAKLTKEKIKMDFKRKCKVPQSIFKAELSIKKM